MVRSTRHTRIFGTAVAALLLLDVGTARSDPRGPGANEIGGTVASARGAEAGVWVIAESQDFKTRFAKIVVTDEAGRFLLPDLPGAKYSVWVRGYGLADSPKTEATPGHSLKLTAVTAPDAATAARSTLPPIGTR